MKTIAKPLTVVAALLFTAGAALPPRACAQGGVPLWTNYYNGSGHTYEAATAVAVDSSGTVFVTGQLYFFYGDINCDGDYATVAYSSSGTPLWTNRYNGPGNCRDYANAIAVDSSGKAFVTGGSWNGTSYDYATLAYLRSGVPLWTNRYNGPGNGDDLASDIAVDGRGSVFVTGKSTGTNGFYDYATVAYSNWGSPLWTNRYNAPTHGHHSSAAAIAVDSRGNVFVTGTSYGTSDYDDDYATVAYSSDGVPLWTNRYDGPGNGYDMGNAVALNSRGNVFVTGRSTGSNGYYDYATVAYSNDGVPLWTNRYGTPGNGNDSARAIAVDSRGDVFVTGTSDDLSAYSDYATVAYSSEGVPLWTNRYSGLVRSYDYANAIAVDSGGNVFVTGSSYVDDYYSDQATVAYSSAGVPLWTNLYNGPGNWYDGGAAVAVNRSGNVFVAGGSAGTNGYYDFVTIKYSSSLPQSATTKYVSLSGGHVPPFTDWVSAATNIQSAIDVSVDGDEIWVADGIYNVTNQIRLAKGVAVRSVHGPTVTIVDGGNRSNRCLYVSHPNALVSGFKIQNGAVRAFPYGDFRGGGVAIANNGTLENCVITGNSADYGGGIWLDHGGLVTNCTIYGNAAGWGGGIQCYYGGMVRNCIVRNNNTPQGAGGGVYCYSGGVVQNSLIHHNSAHEAGGVRDDGGTILNCTICYNSASLDDGGYLSVGGGTLKNSILYFNTAPNGPNYRPEMGNSFTYTCTLPARAGTGNITNAPLFVNAAAGDFHLKSAAGRWTGSTWTTDTVTSACIDAGDPASPYSNEPTPNGGRINLGAYGNTPEASKSSAVNPIARPATYPMQRLISTAASQPRSLAVGDLDGDGSPDVVSASGRDDKIAWYRSLNRATAFASQSVISTSGDIPNDICVADIDGDGDNDVVAGDYNPVTLQWYENTTGDGTAWTAHTISTVFSGIRAVTTADVDSDGRLDVVTCGDDNKLAWHRNVNGNATTWMSTVVATNSEQFFDVEASDLDGDGHCDLAACASPERKVYWYRNADGSGSNWTTHLIAGGLFNVDCIHVADVNGDGHPDVAAGYYGGFNWYEGGIQVSNWPVHVIDTQSSFNWTGALDGRDLDNDGDVDFCVAYSDLVAWYENTDGLGAFVPRRLVASGLQTAAVALAADMNGDGYADLLSASMDDNIIAWYPNTLGHTPDVSNDGGARDITTKAARLGGSLLSTGSAPTHVSFFYGLTDGGTAINAWSNRVDLGIATVGGFSRLVTGLAEGTRKYYYRAYATNVYGDVWAERTTNFLKPAWDVIDQQQPHPDGNLNAAADYTLGTNVMRMYWQQEVTAGLQGQLRGFDLYAQGPGYARFYVNKGPAWQSDANDFEAIATNPVAGWFFVDTSSANIVLNPGDKFVIGVRAINGGLWLMQSGKDEYPYGALWRDGSLYNGAMDLAFRTYMNANHTNATVVNFAGGPTNGVAPLTVVYTNLSSGATSYTWDFGDGTGSTEANPVHIYTTGGNFSVTLIAVGAGGTNTLTRTNFVRTFGSPFAGGNGTPGNPFLVSDATQLNHVRNYPAAYFIQTSNICLNVPPWNSASGWEPIHAFAGSYDGRGYIISELIINRPSSGGVSQGGIGLFSDLTPGGRLRNIAVVNANVIGRYFVGVLVGDNNGGLIENCYSTGAVTVLGMYGGYGGGLIGRHLNNGIVRYSYSRASVTATSTYSGGDVGGLVGTTFWVTAAPGHIYDCYSIGAVGGYRYVGGFLGHSGGGNVSQCYWNMSTSGQPTSDGGAGRNTTEMTYPHATNTYVGWDFTNKWAISAGVNDGYPRLRLNNYPPQPDASATVPVVISPNSTNALVILDGSRSSDPDGDPLHYFWYQVGDPNAFATGVVAVMTLPVGTNALVLAVDDGLATNRQTFSVNVISIAEVLRSLRAKVRGEVVRPQALLATLTVAQASINRGNLTAAIHQLQAFQSQVRARVAPQNPILANQLIQTAQRIIDALSGSERRVRGQFTRMEQRENGKVWMRLSASPAATHIIEASTNLVDWEMIGVATDCGGGTFECNDSDAALRPTRFYRIRSLVPNDTP